jgi:maleylacetate reductase
MDMIDYEFGRTQRLIAGRPAVQCVAEESEKLGARRVFIIASQSVMQKSNLLASFQQALGSRLAGVYTGIRAHAPQEDILDASSAARAAEADLLVSVGGGTPIDSTKIVQLCLTHDITTRDQLNSYAYGAGGLGGAIHNKVGHIRSISVPTTLSGAEFAALGGALVVEMREKQGFSHPELAPIAIIFDPELAVQTPASLWYSAAIRTIDHGAEGYLSPDGYPILQEQFLSTLKLMSNGLKQSFTANSEQEKRDALMLSFQGVWSVAPALGRVRMGASHGLGYILGAMFGVAHGETSCVLLPAVLQWNAQTNQADQDAISNALGAPNQPAHETVGALIKGFGLPSCLADVGIGDDKFDEIADAGIHHGLILANSRQITRRQDILDILHLARV